MSFKWFQAVLCSLEEFQGVSRGLRQICAVSERFSDFWRRLREI